MFKKQSFPVVIGFMLSFFVALLMPFAVFFLANGSLAGYGAEQFLKDFIMNLAVGFLVGSLIPVSELGAAFAKLIGIKNEKGLPFHVVRTAVIAVIMVFLLSLILMFLELGFMPGFFGIWIKMFPAITGIVFIYLLFVLPLSAGISMKLCTKD